MSRLAEWSKSATYIIPMEEGPVKCVSHDGFTSADDAELAGRLQNVPLGPPNHDRLTSHVGSIVRVAIDAVSRISWPVAAVDVIDPADRDRDHRVPSFQRHLNAYELIGIQQ